VDTSPRRRAFLLEKSMDNKIKVGGLVVVIVAAVGVLVFILARQNAPASSQPLSTVGGRTGTPPPMTPITTP
jgi:hypothetical protein